MSRLACMVLLRLSDFAQICDRCRDGPEPHARGGQLCADGSWNWLSTSPSLSAQTVATRTMSIGFHDPPFRSEGAELAPGALVIENRRLYGWRGMKLPKIALGAAVGVVAASSCGTCRPFDGAARVAKMLLSV